VRSPREQRQSRIAALSRQDPAQLRQRMTLQEALFEEPAGDPWRCIDNAASVERLEQAVERFDWTNRNPRQDAC
jgi:hypothetical protein